MKNLDQLRAQNALRHKDRITESKGGGDAISGFPMLLLTDGLLAALAFACEWKEWKPAQGQNQPPGDPDTRQQVQQRDREGRVHQQWQVRKNPGEYTVARAIADHLHSATNPITESANADALIAELARQETDTLLRRSTAETIAFLNYLKRFVA